MVPGVLRLGLAQSDEVDGVQHRHHRQGDHGRALEAPAAGAAEGEQVDQRRQGDQGDGHVGPEAGGVLLQPVGHGLRAVGAGGEGGHKAHHQGDGHGDAHGPGDGALPVHPAALQGQDGGQRHHQGEHVVPPGVEGGVHHLEGGVEEGHHGHEEQDPQ